MTTRDHSWLDELGRFQLGRLIGIAALVFALVCVLPAGAQAQEGEADEGGEEVGGDVIEEEITVTSRKREETLQEVPFSVVAPTEEMLRERGAENLEDVSANVGGFTVQNLGPGQSQIAMRGVSSGQIVRDQPGVKEQVGVYLDESVISLSLFTPDIDLFDMARVEVLRGPQGTLFGSGSASGTVRYITNQPRIGVSDERESGEYPQSIAQLVGQPQGFSRACRVGEFRVLGFYLVDRLRFLSAPLLLPRTAP